MIKPIIKYEIKEFNKALNKFIKNNNINIEKVIKKVAFDLLANILHAPPKGRHPIDTGRSRAAWYPSIIGLGGSFDIYSGANTLKKKAIDEGIRRGKFVNRLKSPFEKYVELINGVHYIIWLEYGSSQQAPYGMVRISMRKMRGMLSNTIEKYTIEEWNKYKF